ncbi:MAG: ABC transporter substrate-binding protein [Nevskiales bacterium]
MTIIVTRRDVVSALASLGAVSLLPLPARADLAELEAAARKEGTLTWYIAQVDAESAEALGRTFTKQYPGISVAVIRTTGQVAYQRLLLDLKNNAPQCDVFSTTDISHMPLLKQRKALAYYVPQNAAGLLPEFKRLSDEGYYYVDSATNHFLIYNSQKVRAEEAPRSWLDLLDPKWKNQVALPHPAFSGCAGVWALGLRKLYGWEYFEKLAKNNPRIGRSFADPVTLLSAGECKVGPGPANSAFPAAEKGNPIGIVYPSDGCSLCVAPSAVPVSAPHPNAGRLFLEWMLSDTYSLLSIERGSEPLRAGLPPKPGRTPVDQLSVIRLSVEEIRQGVPEVIEAWRDTFGS